MHIKEIMGSLIEAESIYTSKMIEVELLITDKVKFEFCIGYQPSDGFVIEHFFEPNVAPLKNCLEVIQEKGKLTLEDFLKNTI